MDAAQSTPSQTAMAKLPHFRPLPSAGICKRLTDRWTIDVLWRLSQKDGQRMRFSALKAQLDGVTQRMLTRTLRNLERDGFVTRHLYAEVPPRVEYELTELGSGVLAALGGFNVWVQDNLPNIKASRQAFDQASGCVESAAQEGR